MPWQITIDSTGRGKRPATPKQGSTSARKWKVAARQAESLAHAIYGKSVRRSKRRQNLTGPVQNTHITDPHLPGSLRASYSRVSPASLAVPAQPSEPTDQMHSITVAWSVVAQRCLANAADPQRSFNIQAPTRGIPSARSSHWACAAMSAESLTQRWLRQHASAYPHKDRVFVDVDAALARFPTVRPKSDIYTYDDGRTQLLLCVHGLLPISFRGASYNIPVAVWVTRDYPRHPPIAYVVPTHDMLIRPSKYVDVSGRCNLDYIQDWQRKSEACNIAALLETMQDQFSRGPPLYAKPKPSSPRPAPQSAAPPSANLSPPPHPSPLSLSQSSPVSQSRNDDRPALPPKPVSSPPPMVPPRPSVPSAMSTHTDFYPRPPPRADTRPPQYQQQSIHPPQGIHLHDGHITSNSSQQSREASSPGGNYRWSLPPESISYSSPSAHVQPPIPAAALPQPIQQVPPRPPQPWSPPVAVPTSDHPPPNLLEEDSTEQSASQHPPGPAPPRPPNPELLQLHAQVHDKIRSELASLSQVMHLDAERLRSQQTDLLAGEPAIRDEMARLEAVRDVCRNVSSRLQSTVGQAERNLAELRRKGDPEVDELVCSTTIVHNQLVNLVAEDNAIEDTIYHLHRALNSGRIDLERFLRTTRVLAEEQFMKRALIEKIQLGIPMGITLPFH